MDTRDANEYHVRDFPERIRAENAVRPLIVGFGNSALKSERKSKDLKEIFICVFVAMWQCSGSTNRE